MLSLTGPGFQRVSEPVHRILFLMASGIPEIINSCQGHITYYVQFRVALYADGPSDERQRTQTPGRSSTHPQKLMAWHKQGHAKKSVETQNNLLMTSLSIPIACRLAPPAAFPLTGLFRPRSAALRAEVAHRVGDRLRAASPTAR